MWQDLSEAGQKSRLSLEGGAANGLFTLIIFLFKIYIYIRKLVLSQSTEGFCAVVFYQK